MTFELTRVTLRRSSDPTHAAADRWNEFEGDYRLEAGSIRRAGHMSGKRDQDYVFLTGGNLPTEPPSVSLTISGSARPKGASVQWNLRPDEPPTRSGEDSESLNCTGTLLTAPAPAN